MLLFATISLSLWSKSDKLLKEKPTTISYMNKTTKSILSQTSNEVLDLFLKSELLHNDKQANYVTKCMVDSPKEKKVITNKVYVKLCLQHCSDHHQLWLQNTIIHRQKTQEVTMYISNNWLWRMLMSHYRIMIGLSGPLATFFLVN